MITSSLEKTLLNFASYAHIVGRSEYANSLRETLLIPEPLRNEQLDILKYSISEILTLSVDNSDFKEFVRKYDLSADNIKEFLRFLGPDSGLNYYPEETEDVFITISSFLKSKLDERLYDRLVLYIKLTFGIKYWENIDYSEMKKEKFDNFLSHINSKSPKLAEYINVSIK